jgi:hypothetical protein
MTALRCLPQFGVDCRCPRQRIDGLRRASSPFLDLPCDSARSTSSMRSDQLLLPTTSTTSTRASRVPSIFPRLAPRSPPKTCDLAKETGGPCVSRRKDPLRRVVRVRVWRFRPIAPKPTGPLASLSLSRSSPAAFAWGRRLRGSQDHVGKCSVKSSPLLWPEMPSIVSFPASSAGSADLESGHVKVSASIQRWCLFAPDRSRFRVSGLMLGARLRTLPNRVKWKRPLFCAKRPAVDFCYD